MPEGAALLVRASSKPLVCFGPTEHSVLTTEGVVLLDDRLDNDDATARLGHLMEHLIEKIPLAEVRTGNCNALVDESLRKEARALSLELRLRKDLGVKRVTYEFEEPYWTMEPSNRQQFVLDYLRSHPDGAPGIDALASAYAKRCRQP